MMRPGLRLDVISWCAQGRRALWHLSGGRVVRADTAAIVITKTCVAPVGDTLFHTTSTPDLALC
jgi:hypothetical protein